jgi:sulfite exporter TauE/SafE
MIEAAKLAIVVALLGTAIIYGTDVFCALVQRPAVAAIDDRALVAVMGNVHRYGDRRLPAPGVIGIASASLGAVLAVSAGRWPVAVAAAIAVALLLIWLVLYLRMSAPINRQLTAAAAAGDTPVNARALQHEWDRIVNARAIIQGAAVTALCVALLT